MIALNLPEIVEESHTDDGVCYVITVACTASPPPCCLLPPVKNGRKEITYRDLNMHGRFVTLKVKRQRFLCHTCHRTGYQVIPNMNDGHMMTQRLVDYLIRRSMETPFKGLERELDIEETVIRRIFRSFAKGQLEALRIETPEYMGLDELHILSKFRGVVTDVKNKTLVELLPNRDQATIIRYLSGLKDRERIKAVTIDMWNPYRRAINLVLPGVPIVVDKFHIVRMAYDAVERVRKAHRASLTNKQRLQLKDDRWILNRRQETLSADQVMILETWLENIPVLKEVYLAREGFSKVWACQTREEAMRTYDQWRTTLPTGCEAAFFDLRLAMKNWRDEIFNYWDVRITNSFTESKNGVTRVINRAGRGYSFEVLRAKMLLNPANQKKKPVINPEPEAEEVTDVTPIPCRASEKMREINEQYRQNYEKYHIGIPLWRLKPSGNLNLINPEIIHESSEQGPASSPQKTA